MLNRDGSGCAIYQFSCHAHGTPWACEGLHDQLLHRSDPDPQT